MVNQGKKILEARRRRRKNVEGKTGQKKEVRKVRKAGRKKGRNDGRKKGSLGSHVRKRERRGEK